MTSIRFLIKVSYLCNFCYSGPLQFLKILLNELIIHEIETIIDEKSSYQFIYGNVSAAPDHFHSSLSFFLKSLGDDFLSKISRSGSIGQQELQDHKNSKPNLSSPVKQEIFDHQVSYFSKAPNFMTARNAGP